PAARAGRGFRGASLSVIGRRGGDGRGGGAGAAGTAVASPRGLTPCRTGTVPRASRRPGPLTSPSRPQGLRDKGTRAVMPTAGAAWLDSRMIFPQPPPIYWGRWGAGNPPGRRLSPALPRSGPQPRLTSDDAAYPPV